jgi:hypothetical protein
VLNNDDSVDAQVIIDNDFNLEPPPWFERHHREPEQPVVTPINDGDETDIADLLEILSDDGSPPLYYVAEPVTDDKLPFNVLWLGRQWACTVRGVCRRDGSHFIPIDGLWSDDAIRAAAATPQLDRDDLKEALRISRRLDCYFDSVRGM